MKRALFIALLCGCSLQVLAECDSGILKRVSQLLIDYICPASSVPGGYYKSRKYLEKFGIHLPREIFNIKNVLSFAGTDEQRLNQFKKACNFDSKIVWTMRGGFGSYKLPELLENWKPKKSKTFVGFSDNTALNLYISQNWSGWTVIHGAGVVQLTQGKYDSKNFSMLLDILEKKVSKYKISGLSPLNKIAETQTNVSGKLTGGNLTLLETSLGTSWEIQSDDKILFIEDCNEAAPKTYRSLYHLKVCEKFKNVRAIIFGEFTGVGRDHLNYLKAFANDLNIPVFKTDKFGHGYHNYPIVYNAEGTISENTLTINLR